VLLLWTGLSPVHLRAQTVLNEHLEQPEVWHFARPKLPTVDAYGGLNLSIPALTVPGRGMDHEITFSYGSGITFSQRASWVGLGWSYDPGSITRKPEGALNHFTITSPLGVDQFEASPAPVAQPDAYHLTLPGHGTVEMTEVNSSDFAADLGGSLIPAVQEGDFATTDHKPWRIEATTSTAAIRVGGIETGTSYDDSYDPCFGQATCYPRPDINRFVVTTGDGTRYVFAAPTLAHFDTRYHDGNAIQFARQAYVSAWRLVAILGSNVTDAVPSTLSGWPDDTVSGGWVRFEYSAPMTAQQHTGSASPYDFTQTRFVEAIVTPTHRAEFISQRRLTPFIADYVRNETSAIYRKLRRIELYSRIDGSTTPIRRVILNHGEGAQGLGPYKNIEGTDVRRLRLKGVRFEGVGGRTRPGYTFEYYDAADPNATSTHRTDHFGYYSSSFASGAVDEGGGRAWSLRAVDYPTGGRLEIRYENDHIADDTIPFTLQTGVSDAYYANTDATSHQGGPRVTSLRRSDGMEAPSTTTFSYGPGRATGVPPMYWRRNEVLTGQNWLFVPSNRGKVSVVYEWIRRERPDGSAIKTYYTTSNYANGGDPNITTIETILARDTWHNSPGRGGMCKASQCTDITVLQGNQHWNWAQPYRVEHVKSNGEQVRVVDRSVRLYRQHPTLASVWTYDTDDHGVISVAIQRGAPRVNAQRTYACPGGATDCDRATNVETYQRYEYDSGTGLRTKALEQSIDTGQQRWTETTYAHERYPGMVSQNMLTPVYSKVTAGRTGTAAKQWTTWSNVDGHWRPREKWIWTGDGSGADTDAPNAPGDTETRRTASYAEYDAHGRVVRQLDGNGHPTYFYYGDNASNRCGGSYQHCASASYDGLRHAYLTSVEKGGLHLKADYHKKWGQLTASTDASGRVRSFTFDAFGRLDQVTGAAGHVLIDHDYAFTSGDPSADPNFVRTTTYGGPSPDQVTTEYIDGIGRSVQTQRQTKDAAIISTKRYDATGRTWKSYRPYRAAGGPTYKASVPSDQPYTETTYDADPLDRVDAVDAPGTGQLAKDYGHESISVGGDASPHAFEVATDEAGHSTKTYTDAFGRQVRSIADPEGIAATTDFVYDLQDNLTAVIRPEGDTLSYRYDRIGQLLERESADAGRTTYRYDAAGNLRFRQDAHQRANGTVHYTTYDGLGRPMASGVAAADFTALDGTRAAGFESDTTTWRHVRAYDAKPDANSYPWSKVDISAAVVDSAAGQLAAEAYRSGATEQHPGVWQVVLYSYDREGRIKTKRIHTEGRPALDTEVHYRYDRQGQLTRRHGAIGSSTYYQWYAFNERGFVHEVFASTTPSRPTTPEVRYTYAADGNVASAQFRGLAPITYTYSSRGWTQEIDGTAGDNNLFRADFTYLPNGGIDRADYRQPGVSGAPVRYRYTHSYDALGRLTSADYAYRDETGWQGSTAFDVPLVSYDRNGNITRLQRHGNGRLIDDLRYTYADGTGSGSPNRLIDLTDAAGTSTTWDAGGGGFSYDAVGRLTAAPAPYHITNATYDEHGLPIKSASGGMTGWYRYAPSGERYHKQVGSHPAQHYFLDGSATLGLMDIAFDRVDVFVEEEQSGDAETSHTTEQVGYLVFGRPGALGAIGETGTVTSGQPDASTWHAVPFDGAHANPVVFAQVASRRDADPVHTRLRSVTPGGFEWQMEEWTYQDGVHGQENVSFAVFESGAHQLSDGTSLEAGTVSTDDEWTSVSFAQRFSSVPVVFAQAQTIHGGAPVVTRIRNITTTGFEVRLQAEEALGGHTVETVGYLAIASGAGTAGVDFEAGVTGDEVAGAQGGEPAWHSVTLGAKHARPVPFSAMQTYDGGDTATVRQRVPRRPRHWNILLPSGEVIGRIDL
jgi:YD repeat-containing protein